MRIRINAEIEILPGLGDRELARLSRAVRGLRRDKRACGTCTLTFRSGVWAVDPRLCGRGCACPATVEAPSDGARVAELSDGRLVKFVNGDPVPKFERGGGTFSDETSADKTANTNAYRASSSAARVMKCIEQRKKKKWADPEFETEFETQ